MERAWQTTNMMNMNCATSDGISKVDPCPHKAQEEDEEAAAGVEVPWRQSDVQTER